MLSARLISRLGLELDSESLIALLALPSCIDTLRLSTPPAWARGACAPSSLLSLSRQLLRSGSGRALVCQLVLWLDLVAMNLANLDWLVRPVQLGVDGRPFCCC